METKTKLESYQDQKTRHSNEISDFDSLFFAFSNEQLEEGLKKIESQKNEIVSIGMGGFVRKDKVKEFIALMKRHDIERKELRKNTKELINAIVYELFNHEYCITGNPNDALEIFDLDYETIDKELWKKVIKEYRRKSV